jgi:hypothetical protein
MIKEMTTQLTPEQVSAWARKAEECADAEADNEPCLGWCSFRDIKLCELARADLVAENERLKVELSELQARWLISEFELASLKHQH